MISSHIAISTHVGQAQLWERRWFHNILMAFPATLQGVVEKGILQDECFFPNELMFCWTTWHERSCSTRRRAWMRRWSEKRSTVELAQKHVRVQNLRSNFQQVFQIFRMFLDIAVNAMKVMKNKKSGWSILRDSCKTVGAPDQVWTTRSHIPNNGPNKSMH